MENTEKSAAQWQEIVSEKDKEIVELRKQVDWFKGQFKLLQSKQFGPSSEKSVELEEQTSLFNEPETLADPKAAEPDLEQIVYKRKKQAGKRELDFSKLPTEQIVHELPEGEQVCPVCGGKMHACGHEVVWRELRYVPAQYKVGSCLPYSAVVHPYLCRPQHTHGPIKP